MRGYTRGYTATSICDLSNGRFGKGVIDSDDRQRTTDSRDGHPKRTPFESAVRSLEIVYPAVTARATKDTGFILPSSRNGSMLLSRRRISPRRGEYDRYGHQAIKTSLSYEEVIYLAVGGVIPFLCREASSS